MYQKEALLTLSRQLGSSAPFGEGGFGDTCHDDFLQVAKILVIQCTAELSAPLFCRTNAKGQYILANLSGP